MHSPHFSSKSHVLSEILKSWKNPGITKSSLLNSRIGKTISLLQLIHFSPWYCFVLEVKMDIVLLGVVCASQLDEWM